MEKKENLYLVKTQAFRGYVVACDLNEAWDKFKNYLDSLGIGNMTYGTFDERKFSSIEQIADSDSRHPKSVCGNCFDDKNKYDVLVL